METPKTKTPMEILGELVHAKRDEPRVMIDNTNYLKASDFAGAIIADRKQIHTSLVAAVEERRIKDLPSSVKDPAGFCKAIGNNQACDNFLTIINSIFKE